MSVLIRPEAMPMVALPATTQHKNDTIVHGKRTSTKGVVIHTVEGSDEGAISWFENPAAGGVGAHVVVGHSPPVVIQLCDLDALCWHAVGANSEYIGIEHEGSVKDSKATWLLRRSQRKMSANRVAWICWTYKLGEPEHGKNVFGHYQFPKGFHTDPGPNWPWSLYIAACKRAYKNLVQSNGKKWS